MRKTALVLSLTVFTAVAASAQTEFDALMFSENNYEGTARTMAMGNAFTALGGDPGAQAAHDERLWLDSSSPSGVNRLFTGVNL